jgi:predicted TIM-barrel fold metal-dependent hydrolase
VDLRLGDLAREVLEAHIRAGGGHFRGIRQFAAWDPDPEVLGPMAPTSVPRLYADPAFRAGFAHLAPLGLSFDAWLVEPQLGELVDLARAFPETPIVLNHIGTPLALGSYAGRLEERFPNWRASIGELAKSPNVTVKLGGLSMPFLAFPNFMANPPASSSELAAQWRPYLETCIEAFGAERCMFESNFPVDRGGCTYATLWNAFKVFAKGYSASEKAALFAGTATRFYRLAI